MLEDKPFLSAGNSIVKNRKNLTFYCTCLTHLDRARTFLYSFIATIIRHRGGWDIHNDEIPAQKIINNGQQALAISVNIYFPYSCDLY